MVAGGRCGLFETARVMKENNRGVELSSQEDIDALLHPSRAFRQPVFYRCPRSPGTLISLPSASHFWRTFSCFSSASCGFSMRPPDCDKLGPGSIDFARLLHQAWHAPFVPLSRLVSGRTLFP